jgi:ElaB/YqjD/DUF883 family membrane-anchored ribosome-binding protein
MTKSKSKSSKIINKNDLYYNLNNIKNALAETTDGLKGRAGELVNDLLENLQDRTSEYQDTVEDFVTDKPLKALAIAAAFGLFIGKFII